MREAQSRGSDSSIGANVGTRVEAILAAGARDAAEIRGQAERDAESTLAAALRDAGEALAATRRHVQAHGAQRIAELARMRQEIADRGEALIVAADHPGRVRQQLESLVIALAHAAELVARESALPSSGAEREAEPARVVEEEPAREEAAEPDSADQRDGAFPGWERRRLAAMRLEALRDAVGGATRSELAERLEPALGPEVARAVLDDVFGSPSERPDVLQSA